MISARAMWPIFIIGGLIVAWLGLDDKKRVFVSYDHSEDVNLRNLLEAWNQNPRFEFAIERTSPMKPIDSDDEAVVKRALTPMLKRADYLLVIVGEKTFRSSFVNWEIERSQEADVNLRIAAVKRHSRCRLPKALHGTGVPIAHEFSKDAILSALNSASRSH